MNLYADNVKFNASKTRRPRFSWRTGQAWDSFIRKIDKVAVEFWYEGGRGNAFYFQWQGVWYRLPFWTRQRPEDCFDVKNFSTKQSLAQAEGSETK